MATKSFTHNTFIVNNENAKAYSDIMNSNKKVKITKVNGHKEVKGKKAIAKLLGL